MTQKQYKKLISDWSKYYNKLIGKYIRNSSNGDMILALVREKNERMTGITERYYRPKESN